MRGSARADERFFIGGGAFPRASRYHELRAPGGGGRVRERRPPDPDFPFAERHLRCVWFDAEHRPPILHAGNGEEVRVESPGRWNVEAGPDFLDAALSIGPGRRRVQGDVEIHIRPGGWREHGHARDPRYGRVVAHVTYLPGRVPEPELPPGAIQIALRDDLARNPFFAFENVDLAAYPYGVRADPAPCAAALAVGPADVRGELLDAAGEERLRRKAQRMAAAIAERGLDQALYEEVMGALGYKRNRVPFRTLARRVPVERLRADSGGRPSDAFALLLGVSGLLPERMPAKWDDESRRRVRGLWDVWWRRSSEWDALVMDRSAWCLAGQRPQNHPVRRLMAAAALFAGPVDPAARLLEVPLDPAADWVRATIRLFEPRDPDGYWGRRCVFGGAVQAEETALVGTGRAASMLVNVVVPLLAAAGRDGVDRPDFLAALPPEPENALATHMAHRLFGRDHNPALYRSALRQQGLLQILHDFCLDDRSRCATCPLPGALRPG